MEGLLCHCALAMQEYNFAIVYRMGSSNGNADALSRCPLQTTNKSAPVAVTSARETSESLQQQQQTDSILQQVYSAVSTSTDNSAYVHWHKSRQSPLRRYYLLCDQLSIVDDVICRTYKPNHNMDAVTVACIRT